jgi:hypothetical protein
VNTFITKFFYSFYENSYIKKILFFNSIKSYLFPFNYKFIDLLVFKSYFTWKIIFEKKFWISKKKFLAKAPSIRFFNFKNNTILIKQKKTFFDKTNIIKNNFIIFFLYNNINSNFSFLFLNFIKTNLNFKVISIYFLNIYKRTFGEGFFYIRGLFIIFFIDACVTDDEPLWEPIEWSLVQTWLLFIFIFAWIGENLIASRYGSYTGRDKKVWMGWYKTFWMIDLIYIISYGVTALFVIVPFYYELTYSLTFIFSWWNWYTRVFFFKFISIFTIVVLIAHLLQLNIRW